MLVAKKAAQEKVDSQSDENARASRKSRQEPKTVEELDRYAEEFYELAMAAYENMRESVRILRLCEPGTTIKPSTTNTTRMMKKVVANAVDFPVKAAKACRAQGRDPKLRLK